MEEIVWFVVTFLAGTLFGTFWGARLARNPQHLEVNVSLNPFKHPIQAVEQIAKKELVAFSHNIKGVLARLVPQLEASDPALAVAAAEIEQLAHDHFGSAVCKVVDEVLSPQAAATASTPVAPATPAPATATK